MNGLDTDYFKKNLSRILRDIESYTPKEMENSLIRLSIVAAPMSIREGWKLVPCIPTEEMVMAAIDAQDNYPSNSWGKVIDLPYDEVYKAMLEAAPKEQS